MNTEIVQHDAQEECEICGDVMSAEQKHTLKCNHSFCYDCLLDSFKGTNCNYNYTTNHRICPYCRMGSGFLPMRPGYSYVKNVHPPSCRFVQKIQCKGCYKSGKSKGLPCTTMVDKNIGYCKRHIPKK